MCNTWLYLSLYNLDISAGYPGLQLLKPQPCSLDHPWTGLGAHHPVLLQHREVGPVLIPITLQLSSSLDYLLVQLTKYSLVTGKHPSHHLPHQLPVELVLLNSPLCNSAIRPEAVQWLIVV